MQIDQDKLAVVKKKKSGLSFILLYASRTEPCGYTQNVGFMCGEIGEQVICLADNNLFGRVSHRIWQ